MQVITTDEIEALVNETAAWMTEQMADFNRGNPGEQDDYMEPSLSDEDYSYFRQAAERFVYHNFVVVPASADARPSALPSVYPQDVYIVAETID